jgi:type IV pilus assembly protein PilF
MNKRVVALSLLLAACAQQPRNQDADSVNGVDSDARQRARAFTNLGAAYYQRGQYKVTLDELRKAILVDPKYGPAYDVYGLVYMELAEDKLAEEYFHRALEIDAGDSEAHNNYGWFLCTRGRYDEGLAQFSVALSNPLYASPELAMANAGSCAEKKGDLAQAEVNFLRALKLQPDNAPVILKLAALRFRQNRLADAERLLARYDEIGSPSAASLWLGVRLERKVGDHAQEAGYALQLRKRFPDSDETRAMLAERYE